MGLFDFLKPKTLNGSVDQLAVLGADESRTNEFIELLAKSNIWVLGAVDELPDTNPDSQKILAHAEKTAQAVAAVQTTSDIRVHTFKLDEFLVVPFFTAQECVQDYIGSIRIEKVTQFPCFECPADILLREDLLRVPAVMNPQSKLSRYFGADDKIALAKRLTANPQS